MKLGIHDVKLKAGVDPAGPVFYLNGSIFRAVSQPYAGLYRRILSDRSVEDLFRSGLVETSVADIELDGYDLVLQHKRVEFPSVWSEWCSLMIREATLFICKLNLELANRGLFTKDTQPGNVLFDYTRPVWVDFGSIVELESVKFRTWLRSFWNQSVRPLWLMSKGRHRLGRALYTEVEGRGMLRDWSSKWPFRMLPVSVTKIYKRSKRRRVEESLEALMEYLSTLKLEPTPSFWSGYGQGGMPPVEEPETFKGKNLAVYNALKSVPPGTLLDMACNKGWYARLAVSLGHRCVAFDLDDGSVCRLFEDARSKSLPILPLLMDFTWPTPPYGIALRNSSAIDRLKCDNTLALAIVHHLVFKKGLSFEAIADTISLFTKKIAIVEFVPPEDRYVAGWMRPEHSWYRLDRFMWVLKRHFSEITVCEEPSGRKLLICRKPPSS
jgi:hypothetical protein